MLSSKTINLNKPINTLPGIGPQYTLRLHKLNIKSLQDLLDHYPRRYLDLTQKKTINQLRPKQLVSFTATLDTPHTFYTRTGKHITQTKASDHTGHLTLTWFNSPYIKTSIKPNLVYVIAGQPSYFSNQLTIVAPQIEPLNKKNTLHTQGFVPIYPQTQGVSSKWLRYKINQLLKTINLTDNINPDYLKKLNLPLLNQAYQHIHFPPSLKQQDLADQRLAFNHHFSISLTNLKNQKQSPPAQILKVSSQIHQQSLKKLPFKLTPDQLSATKDLYQDISTTNPTPRLIQGDTGSGKTAILILLANQCLKNDYSIVILAPTQILAQQHFHTFKKFSLYPENIKLVTANTKTDQFPSSASIFIGTHALLNQLPNKLKKPIAILAIDEQHKFGVHQRQKLLNRNPSPHLVNLSATPIPRTVALGLFGEINITTIKNKPQNRQPVITWIVDNQRLKKGHSWLEKKLKAKNKIFIVCPHIKKSSLADSVASIYPQYKNQYQSLFPVWQLHGQMPIAKREKIIDDFQKSTSGLLVSTPLIEVGIDIPNANVIIIHSAERFGLAQLHQLRGRVGRGHKQAYCLIVPKQKDQVDLERLQLLKKHHSGLQLAKLDLKLRGAGELFGLKQHGKLPTRLKHFWNKNLYQQAKLLAKNQLNSK